MLATLFSASWIAVSHIDNDMGGKNPASPVVRAGFLFITAALKVVRKTSTLQ